LHIKVKLKFIAGVQGTDAQLGVTGRKFAVPVPLPRRQQTIGDRNINRCAGVGALPEIRLLDSASKITRFITPCFIDEF